MLKESESVLIPSMLKKIYVWDATRFVSEVGTDNKVVCPDPLTAINWFVKSPNTIGLQGDGFMSLAAEEGSALFLLDTAHRVQATGPHAAYCEPSIPRALKKAWSSLAFHRKPVIIVSHTADIPPELEHYIVFTEHELPSEKRLRGIIKKAGGYFMESPEDQEGILNPTESEISLVVSQLNGMTQAEADNILARAAQENTLQRRSDPSIVKGFDLEIMHEERVHRIRKSSSLEIIHPIGGLEMVGGLPDLKEYFKLRKKAFDPEWLNEGLDYPKGVLLAGLSGTGKTLLSACIGKEWGATVIRGDVGACKGSLVGESEKNFRKMLQDVEDIAGDNSKVVFQLDKICPV